MNRVGQRKKRRGTRHTVPRLFSFAFGRVLDRLGGCLRGHFDVEHSTLQLEPAGHAVSEQLACEVPDDSR